MDTIIGLGNAGCNIADMFAQYPQYLCYKFNRGLKRSKTTFPLKDHENFEDYETKMPNMRTFLKEVKGEVLFVLGGASKVSSCALKILETIKTKSISVLYIQPDISLLNHDQEKLERLVYAVLQEYSRSGLIKEIILVSNSEVENILGELTLKNYYHKINELIVSTFHMMNIYQHNDSFFNTFQKKPTGVRISTFGMCDPKTNEEKMFFPLDNVSDVVYYYAYNKEEIETNPNLLNKIKKNINKKKEEVKRVTYGIYETDYEDSYLYCAHSTSFIQA